MNVKSLVLSTLVVPFATSLAFASEPSLQDVLKSTPKPANAVVHLDLGALRKLTLGTPMEIDLPSRIDRVRIASEIDLARLQPEWEIGYGTMKQVPNADTVAKATGGYVDSVGNRDVVWTPNQMYLVPLNDGVLSMVRPADRKLLSQWLRKDRNASDSKFLAAAASTMLDNLAVMIAVDLEDVISASSLIEYLPNFQTLKGKDLKAVAKNLASLRGVKLAIASDSLANSVVTLSFQEAPTEIIPIAKEFFGEVLQRRGSALGDISKWKVTSDPSARTIQFSGSLTPAVLDDVLGIFTIQRQSASIEQHAEQEQQKQGNAGETSQSMIAENTRNYFKKVINIAHRVRDYSASNTGERAQWNGNMAGRIDELPTLGVDTEMVDFAAEVAKSLRNNMASMQLTNISFGAQAIATDAGTGGFSTATAGGVRAGYASSAYGSYSGYGGGGFTDPNSPVKYFQLSQSQGNASFKQLMAQVDQAIADMRRKMTDKYSIQF